MSISIHQVFDVITIRVKFIYSLSSFWLSKSGSYCCLRKGQLLLSRVDRFISHNEIWQSVEQGCHLQTKPAQNCL